MDQIEEIKRKVDIVDLISKYITLKRAGRNFKARCPFHDEKTASFIVSPELQIFKCFGCGVGGDAIKFLQLYEKMDFWEAVETLAQRVGVKLTRRRVSQDEQAKRKLYEINSLVTEFCHFLLTKHQVGRTALGYLAARGIKPKSIETFQLGFSPKKPEIIVSFLKKKGYSVPEILQSGVAVSTRRGTLLDRFHGRLIFPLYDHRGNVVGFSGRLIPGISLSEQAKYINTSETRIYHKGENLYGLWLTKREIQKRKEAIVVEGEFDLISPYQEGVTNLVAIKGTAFTESQARLINRFAETAILALDADFAGDEAVKKSAQVADQVGLDVRVALLPKGFKDPDEVARKKPKLLKKALLNSIPAWDFIINLALKRNNIKESTGKKKVLAQTLPFLTEIENEVVKSHYFQKLAEELAVSLEAVLIEADKSKAKLKARAPVTREQPPSSQERENTRRHLLEKDLVSLIFNLEEWSYLKDKSWFSLINDPLLKRIVTRAHKFIKGKRKLSAKIISDSLPEELRTGFEELYLSSEKGAVTRGKDPVEIALTCLRREDLHYQLQEISAKIAHSEKQGENKKVAQLEKKFVDVSRKLVQLGED